MGRARHPHEAALDDPPPRQQHEIRGSTPACALRRWTRAPCLRTRPLLLCSLSRRRRLVPRFLNGAVHCVLVSQIAVSGDCAAHQGHRSGGGIPHASADEDRKRTDPRDGRAPRTGVLRAWRPQFPNPFLRDLSGAPWAASGTVCFPEREGTGLLHRRFQLPESLSLERTDRTISH